MKSLKTDKNYAKKLCNYVPFWNKKTKTMVNYDNQGTKV